jgi:hypothetical protein
MAMTFVDSLHNRGTKSDWITWLIQSTDKPAVETLAFLSKCYSEVPLGKRASLSKRLKAGDQQEVYAAITELVIHELLKRLDLQPEWSPILQDLTPDLKFQVAGQEFVADVVRVKSPSKTVRERGKVILSWDKPTEPSESRAKKIADRIAEKATKYSKLKLPFVAFIFRGDHYLSDVAKVEVALYGMTLDEITLEAGFPTNLGHGHPYPGILLPRDGQETPHRNLAAVVYCDWFDTLNRADEGKRLHCIVLHNWAASTVLPIEAFGSFGQITWFKTDIGRWAPRIIGDRGIVSKFIDGDSMEMRIYSAAAPW